jgi:hypothetical protein
MLATIYLMLTAKPVSLRRLIVLFVCALVYADLACWLLGVKQASHRAIDFAAAATALAWISPMVQLAYGLTPFRTFHSPTLARVSGFIMWTYGFAIAYAFTLIIIVASRPMHILTIATLSRLVPVAAVAGAILVCAANSLRFRPSSKELFEYEDSAVRVRSCTNATRSSISSKAQPK